MPKPEYISIPPGTIQDEFTDLTPEEMAVIRGEAISDKKLPNLSEGESTLISQSEQLNRDFFGDQYDTLFSESIPRPNFSEQVWQYLEKRELAAYYLPDIQFPEITKDTNIPAYIKTLETIYPNWLLPEKLFFDRIKEYQTTNPPIGISPTSLTLKGGWRFIETVQKPNYQTQNDTYTQRYPVTSLMTDIANSIQRDNQALSHKLESGDRFGITWTEITGNEVDSKGKLTGKRTNRGITDYASQVLNNPARLPIELEWSILANFQVYQEKHQKPAPNDGLGSTNTWEWLEDERPYSDGDVYRLVAGGSGGGGLQGVSYSHPSVRYGYVGFRLFGSD